MGCLFQGDARAGWPSKCHPYLPALPFNIRDVVVMAPFNIRDVVVMADSIECATHM